MSAQENLETVGNTYRGEFMTKDTDLSLSTMVEDASVIDCTNRVGRERQGRTTSAVS